MWNKINFIFSSKSKGHIRCKCNTNCCFATSKNEIVNSEHIYLIGCQGMAI